MSRETPGLLMSFLTLPKTQPNPCPLQGMWTLLHCQLQVSNTGWTSKLEFNLFLSKKTYACIGRICSFLFLLASRQPIKYVRHLQWLPGHLVSCRDGHAGFMTGTCASKKSLTGSLQVEQFLHHFCSTCVPNSLAVKLGSRFFFLRHASGGHSGHLNVHI